MHPGSFFNTSEFCSPYVLNKKNAIQRAQRDQILYRRCLKFQSLGFSYASFKDYLKLSVALATLIVKLSFMQMITKDFYLLAMKNLYYFELTWYLYVRRTLASFLYLLLVNMSQARKKLMYLQFSHSSL